MVTVDPDVSSDLDAWATDVGLGQPATGSTPEAFSRMGEAAWTRLDPTNKAFLIALNDYYSTAISAAVTAMQAALDTGAANRIVLDMRYLQGGKRGPCQVAVRRVGGRQANQPPRGTGGNDWSS